MTEHADVHSGRKSGAGTALAVGLLLPFPILVLWADSPSDIVGLLTGINPALPYDRFLKYPIVVCFLFLFCWRAVALYRRRTISLPAQFGYTALALLLGAIWFVIAVSRLQFNFIR
jgi:hypothetical protein